MDNKAYKINAMITVVFPIPDRGIKKPKSEIEGMVYMKFTKLKIGFEVILYSLMIIPIRPPIRKADIRDINEILICCEIRLKKKSGLSFIIFKVL